MIRRNILIVIIVWVLAVIAVLPVLFHWLAGEPRMSRTDVATWISWAVAALICFLIYRTERRRSSPKQAIAVALTVLFLTCLMQNVHRFYVDEVTNLFPYATNEKWQEGLQNNVIALHADVAPHSYRFLPNGIVRWLEIGHVSYLGAATLYRLLTNLFLSYGIYRFARLYTNFAGAILAMFVTVALFPVGLERYAGQLTDPLSYLSFVLAFIFLEVDNFPLLFSTLIIGSLAKETVLPMAGYYVLFGRRSNRFTLKSIALCAGSLLAYFGVRFYVLHGSMQYKNVSGVDTAHILDNLSKNTWPEIVMLMVLGMLYFLLLSWRDTPIQLKRLYFYLTPVLLLSSLLFSWFNEGRNYIPLVMILGVMAGHFCARQNSVHCSEGVEVSAECDVKTAH